MGAVCCGAASCIESKAVGQDGPSVSRVECGRAARPPGGPGRWAAWGSPGSGIVKGSLTLTREDP
eukprot:5867818-Prymnesium_polylepis.1